MPFFVVNVALPLPMRRTFDYLPLAGESAESYRSGARVRLEFNGQLLVGIILSTATDSAVPRDKLLPILERLDEQPLLGDSELALCHWLADYYHHSLGEVTEYFLPTLLRRGAALSDADEAVWHRQASDAPAALRGRKQQALWQLFTQQDCWPHSALTAQGFTSSQLKSLEQQELIYAASRLPIPTAHTNLDSPPTLNQQQQQALAALCTGLGRFTATLLEGITGSGKTEVYLCLIEAALQQGKQALVLVPEIGLTPQTVRRFQARFRVPIALLHSGLNERERLQGWRQAKEGVARILIGTRSAVFTPMPELGLIIIDEEHDGSFKQQDGLRYNARDLALVRASKAGFPVLLGSATPSLGTLHNALTGKYQHLLLNERAGVAKPPQIRLHSLLQQNLTAGFTNQVLQRMRTHLEAQKQILVFINRRGYAPLLACPHCAWQAQCRHCDARLTLHQNPSRLLCHHCDYQQSLVQRCPNCGHAPLQTFGQGTEKLADELGDLFPNTPIYRVDRDTVRSKQAFDQLYDTVHQGEAGILVGTQMLAKGHHFPDVTLVVIVDADAGLFSQDFRALEHSAQLIEQVAGRAGRAEAAGEVWIQTLYASHPLLNLLVDSGYHALALSMLDERRKQQLPPFAPMAILHSSCTESAPAQQLLRQALHFAQHFLAQHYPKQLQAPVNLLGPSPAIMERRAGRFRYQLQLIGQNRQALHRLLHALTRFLDDQKTPRKVRWHLDVDPFDTL